MRGDKRTDEHTDGGSDSSTDSGAYCRPYCRTDDSTVTSTYCGTDHCTNHAPLQCWHSLLLAQHDRGRGECDMHGDGRRRLRVRVSCGVYADTSALLAFGLGSVAGASTPMRDDSIADEHTDGGSYSSP